MALAGEGAICIWNDITPEGRAEFFAWHNTEHIPERVGIPGFLRGRRYRALGGATDPEFFTLYETTTVDVLSGAAYLARLNAPTPWTKTATLAFRNTSRALTRVAGSLGHGSGGILATLRFAVSADRHAAAPGWIRAELLPAIMALPEIAGAHLCLTNSDASAARTAESRDRTDILAAPEWIVLIEACGSASAGHAAALASAQLQPLGGSPVVGGLYGLDFDLLAR